VSAVWSGHARQPLFIPTRLHAPQPSELAEWRTHTYIVLGGLDRLLSEAKDAETGQRGFVLTGPEVRDRGRWDHDRDPYLLETSVPGIFACGDVRYSPVKRVAAAVGEGSMAIAFVHQYLRDDATAARA